DRKIWGGVVDCCIDVLKSSHLNGRKLLVGENIKFKGGYMAQWIRSHYPDSGCVLSIELKKIFMDEWTGAVDIQMINSLRNILKETVIPVFKTATKLKGGQ